MKRLLLTVTLASLLAACALGPNYKRPEVKTPAAFRGQAAPLDGNEGSGPIDDGADWRILDADDLGIRDQGSQPVKEVQDFGPGDPGKEILVPSRESDDFVRKDRP